MMAARELNAYKLVSPKDVIFTRDAFDITVEKLQKRFGEEPQTTT